MTKKVVFPGDEVAIEEEYLGSEGTFSKNGIVYASQYGVLELDHEECVARVISPNPPNILKIGDVVYAIVQEIRKTMATADVVYKEGVDRTLGGETYATIHVSKISSEYTDDVSKDLRKGDYIRAIVTGISPSLQLSTKEDHYGVIKSFCWKCKTPLERRGKNVYCTECEKTYTRKLADDYGDVEF